MAALVAAIHVFAAVSKVVDGWAEPSHDVEMALGDAGALSPGDNGGTLIRGPR
jgi:hypothetical protein